MKPININKKINESSQFESKRVPENEIEEKGYQYFSTHGVGPSTLPSDVNVKELDIKLPNGWVTFKTDRPLSDDEIKYYDIQPDTNNSDLKKKFKLDESYNYTTYSVVVGWNGLIGVENEYNIGARSRGDAVYHAIDEPGAEAEQDLSVEDITDNGEYLKMIINRDNDTITVDINCLKKKAYVEFPDMSYKMIYLLKLYDLSSWNNPFLQKKSHINL